jgi:uncharacterized protein
MQRKIAFRGAWLCVLVLSGVSYSSAQTNPVSSSSPGAVVLQERDYRIMRVTANNLTKEQVLELREKAAAGDRHAQEVLGMAYELGSPGAKSDVAEALKWYRMAADQGSSIGANQIATYYDPAEVFAGQHYGHEPEQALSWYRKAAERGDDSVAQYNVAAMLLQMGRRDESLEWYRKAIANGSSYAAVGLVGLYDQGLVLPGKSKHENWKAGAAYFEDLAAKGNPGAEYVMGNAHREGWLGVKKDPALGFDMFRKAAAQGWTRAILLVGDCYFKGEGVRQDKVEALKWLKQAANEGDPIGASYMAFLYERGELVPKDVVEAYAWDLVAVRHGKGIKLRSLTPQEEDRARKRAVEIYASWGEAVY